MPSEECKVPKEMMACRVKEFGKPLECEKMKTPEPEFGEVLVKITMCGVCHTDLNMRTGDLSFKPDLPITLGHEGVGKICKLGQGVKHLKVGDRVCLGVMTGGCNRCHDCMTGHDNACAQNKLRGISAEGCFANFAVANADYVCLIPDNVSDEEAAPINCAGVTVYAGLRAAKVRPGQWVVIVGAAGGLGYYAVQYAKAMGLKIIAVDKGQEKMDFLKQFEKEIPNFNMFDCEKGDVTQKINELTCGGAHSALVIAPEMEPFEEAPKYLRKRGILVVIGQAPGKASFDLVHTVMNMISIVGSMCGTRNDLKESLQFVADGIVKSDPCVHDFKDINHIMDEMQSQKVIGRNVVRVPEPEAE